MALLALFLSILVPVHEALTPKIHLVLVAQKYKVHILCCDVIHNSSHSLIYLPVRVRSLQYLMKLSQFPRVNYFLSQLYSILYKVPQPYYCAFV